MLVPIEAYRHAKGSTSDFSGSDTLATSIHTKLYHRPWYEMTVNVYLALLIQELISVVGASSLTVCIIERLRFTPTCSEASYTAITEGVVRSRSKKQFRAILEVKPNFT
ncbi:hypothetical protein GB937_005348 [Aspergillus fischeri]|nr:hypothetical protein GB937_005348 [Aspergillus fischeri]